MVEEGDLALEGINTVLAVGAEVSGSLDIDKGIINVVSRRQQAG